MNKFIIITVLTLFSIGAHAQSIKVNETDPFSGKAKIETSVVEIDKPRGECSMKINDGAAFFCIMATADFVDMQEEDTATVLFLTKNNNVVTLEAESVGSGVVERKSSIHWGFGISSGKSKQLTSVFVNARVPLEAFEQIYKEGVDTIRVVAGKSEIDITLNNSLKNKIWKLFNLTREYITPEE